MSPARQIRVVLLTLGLCFALPSRAVDPLPPDLEHAPLEVRAEYWDRMGRHAQEEKIRVGQARHEVRQALQQSIAVQLQTASSTRLDDIKAEMTLLAEPAAAPSQNNFQSLGLGIVLLLAIVFIVRKLRPEAGESLRDYFGHDMLSPSNLARFLSEAPAGVAAVLSGMRPAPSVAARSTIRRPHSASDAIEISPAAGFVEDGLPSLDEIWPGSLGGLNSQTDGLSPKERLRQISLEPAEEPTTPPTAPQDFLSQAAARLAAMRKKLQALDQAQAQPVPPAPPPSDALPVEPAAKPASDPMPGSSIALPESAQEFIGQAPALLAALRKLLEQISATDDEMDRQEMLINLYLQAHSLACKAGLATLGPAMKLASALEGLLKKLFESPSQANPDTFRTIANAVDLLGDLCVAGLPTDLSTNPPVRMLVVDDDLLARRAMTTALQMAFEQPDSANDGASALALAAQESYEVIFLDVQMPDMDGFTLCSKIRQTIPNSTTPVVFVTSQADADARTRALECGGSDLLAKPFLLIELTVKALTFALRGRLQQLKAARN